MADGGRFDVADVQLEVVHTPGHTPGSVSLYCAELEVVFTGDALAAGGPVPHEGEFPDFARQLTAIGERLLDLPSRTRVLPGHGEETHDRRRRQAVRRLGDGRARRARLASMAWSSSVSRGCRGGCTRARRPGSRPGSTARAATG